VSNGRNGDYGYDGSFHTVSAGVQLAAVGAGSAGLLAGAGVALARGNRLAAAIAAGSAAQIVATTASFIYATRSGKFHAWDRILDDLRLRGDETLLDMGCGRGAVLLAAAKRLPRGRAIGVDLWRPDQTENSQDGTLANAALEDVADRVELHTADMTALPLADGSVDVSSAAWPSTTSPIAPAGNGPWTRRFVCYGPAAGSPSRTCGRPGVTPPAYGSWAGETCSAATSDGACGTAVRGSPRAWSPPRNHRRAC
jgi:Methyltransferase domain